STYGTGGRAGRRVGVTSDGDRRDGSRLPSLMTTAPAANSTATTTIDPTTPTVSDIDSGRGGLDRLQWIGGARPRDLGRPARRLRACPPDRGARPRRAYPPPPRPAASARPRPS